VDLDAAGATDVPHCREANQTQQKEQIFEKSKTDRASATRTDQTGVQAGEAQACGH
jgi:hypothetical protein